MNKKTFLSALVIVVIVAVGIGALLARPGSPEPVPQSKSPEIAKKITPSETFIEYADPAGFTFSYPDNVSIEKNEEPDESTYTDLQLFSKDVSGNLSVRISDTKLKTTDDWLKQNQITASASAKLLGNLNGIEVKTADRLFLTAIDQGVLFAIEMPKTEEEFWNKVYSKVTESFIFAVPDTTSVAGGGSNVAEEVVFEGEEVVE